MNIVLLVKLLHLIWHTDKLNNIMKFAMFFLISTNICGICVGVLAPLVYGDKKLMVPIGFPLDYENDEFAGWMAFAFLASESTLAAISMLFPVITWYLLANCVCRYEVLSQQLKNIGKVEPATNDRERHFSNAEKDNLYLQHFIDAINSWNFLKE